MQCTFKFGTVLLFYSAIAILMDYLYCLTVRLKLLQNVVLTSVLAEIY